jgi:hypothetical protein
MPTTMHRALPVLMSALLLAACASMQPGPEIPENAVAATRTEANGDVVTEYRVQGQLRMVKVVPFRGPAYYLVDRDGDGKMDPLKGDAPVTYYKLYGW